MAFAREASRVPVAIADMEVRLFDPDPLGTETAGAAYSVQIRMSDGSIVTRSGDLVPHISAAQRNSLLSFMQTLRTKAIAEFLPE